MKRLLVATSVFALALGGAAMAQSNYSAPNGGAPGANSANTPMDSSGNMNATGSSTGTRAGQGSGAGSQGSMGAQNSGMGGSQGSMGAQNSGNAGTQDNMQSNAPSENSGATRVSTNDIRHAQRSLKEQGLYKGHVDGKFGPETRTAVSEFQKQNGLPQTASLDEQTMNDLRSGGKGMSHGGSSNGMSGGTQSPAQQH